MKLLSPIGFQKRLTRRAISSLRIGRIWQVRLTVAATAANTFGGNSTTLPPIESIETKAAKILLRWDAKEEGLLLETTSHLGGNQSWTFAFPSTGNSEQSITAELPMLSPSAFYRLRSGSTLTDFWNGKATWVADVGGIGRSVGFHFPSMIYEGTNIVAYFIDSYAIGDKSKMVVSRAVSSDGITWAKDAIMVDVSEPERSWLFESETAAYHQTGMAAGDGWAADRDKDDLGYLVFGPYTTGIPTGPSYASFRLMLLDQPPTDLPLVTLDIYDSTAKQIIAIKSLYSHDFASLLTYQEFQLPFAAISGNVLEFRTYWHKAVSVKQDRSTVTTKKTPAWDDRMASFPGVWRDDGTYYLVYEGAGESPESPGDIGLAVSQDGRHFTKSPVNPILRHNTGGWERVNIGTPSLYKRDGTWFLFYHAWDGVDCRLGVATGSSLTNLTKYAGNPIITTATTGWDSGTVGRRTRIFEDGGWYYLGFEGSTDQPYNAARWSTGLARSRDLLHWEKFADNPVVSQTVSGFGSDGPELIRIAGDWFLYVRVSGETDSPTKRYRLVPR